MKNDGDAFRLVHPQVAISMVLAALVMFFLAPPAGATGGRTGTAPPLPSSILEDGLADPQDFEAFLDPLLSELMASSHIPGGAVAVVKDGQVFFVKGYGYADLERRIPVSADTTIFRTGSLSKVFTWTAVMQLVEQGKLDLYADVNTYLTHFQIPATFAQPITLAQLMTHTAGFEDQNINGAVYTSADGYQPLQEFLAEKMPARIFPPGQVVAYSNYGAALAGEIVAEVSGEAFDQYIAGHILGPLKMDRSTFLQPLPSWLASDAAVSYAVDKNGLPHPGSFEFIQVQPAGALSSTAMDMANFMLAHLQDGRLGKVQILQPEIAQDMRRQHYAFNPRLPGITRGFFEAYRNNIHVVLHAGSTELTSSLLALMPDQEVGIFMTFNSYINVPARLAFLNALLDRYYPEPARPVVSPPVDFAERAARFTGNYLMSRRAETNLGKLASPLYEVSVGSNPDGTLTVDSFRNREGVPIRWVEVEPLVFQEAGGQSLLAFGADAQGQVTSMFHGDQPIFVFQKLAWYKDPRAHLAGLGLGLLVFLVTAFIWPLGALLRLLEHRPVSPTRLERWGRYLAGGLVLLNLVIAGLVLSVLAGDDSLMQLGTPAGFKIASSLAFVSGAGAIALLAFTAEAWRQQAWGIVGRLHYTLVAIAALYFLWYLIEINLTL